MKDKRKKAGAGAPAVETHVQTADVDVRIVGGRFLVNIGDRAEFDLAAGDARNLTVALSSAIGAEQLEAAAATAAAAAEKAPS